MRRCRILSKTSCSASLLSLFLSYVYHSLILNSRLEAVVGVIKLGLLSYVMAHLTSREYLICLIALCFGVYFAPFCGHP